MMNWRTPGNRGRRGRNVSTQSLTGFERLESRTLLAANVLVVSNPSDFANQDDDSELLAFLVDAGNSVDADSGAYIDTVPNAQQLEDVDVILFSRATRSTDYDGAIADAWNAIDKPIVILNSPLLRTNRWGLVDSAQNIGNEVAPANYTLPDANHPFVSGLTSAFATAGQTIDILSIAVTDPAYMPGSTIVASGPFGGTETPLILDTPAGGTTFGTLDVLGGRRVLFDVPDYPDRSGVGFADVLTPNAQSILAQIIDVVSAPEPQELTLQAEDASLSGGAVASEVHPGANPGENPDGDFVDFPSSGGAVEWTLPSLPAGEFDFTFRYANGDNNANDRPLQLIINDQVIEASLSFPSTGVGQPGWSNWMTVEVAGLTLPAGINRVRLEAVGNPGPNIDEFRLFGVLDAPPPTPVNLVATGVSETQVNVTWDDVDGETGYIVQRRETAGGVFAAVATLPADAAYFSDLGLQPSTSYTYRVIADRSGTASDPSNTDEATTQASTTNPGVLVIAPGAGATDVVRDVIISASLITPNGGILPSTLTSDSVLLYPTSDPAAFLEASLQTSGGGDTLIVNPAVDLAPDTSYTLEITSDVTDPSGAPFTPFTTTFTTGAGFSPLDNSIRFERVELVDEQFTAVTIGPDGRLYAARPTGEILRYDLLSDGTLGAVQSITSLQTANGGNRLLVGLTFDPASTAGSPILWTTHTSFGFAGEPDFQGKLTRLSGPDLTVVEDAVVNLPRSARDHVTNQIAFGPDGAIYFLQGSNSANGAADSAWSLRDERLLSAALLRFDPALYDFVANGPLDAHTEDADPYDPFANGAPLTIYASGIRNAYDLVWHSNGSLYVPSNANGGQGNTPDQPGPGEAPPGGLTPRIDEALNGPFIPPEAVDGIIGTGPSNDFLFRVEEAGYYGHPNPTRNEFIQDGGNPTAGVDPDEFDRYPVGVQPDRNYRGSAFDFGARVSPNGVIEYQYDGFGGALQNKLIVARYSTGDDLIVLDPSGPNGEIVSSNDAIESFDDLVDPLDLVEDPTNGNLYVAGFVQNSADGTLYLLRPIEVEPPEVNEAYYFSHAVGAGPTNPTPIALENETGQTLVLQAGDVTISGSGASRFAIDPASFPLSISAGGVFEFGVTFDPASTGVVSAQVTVATGDATTPSLTANLRGLGQSSFGGNGEPALSEIVELYEFTTDVGFTGLNPQPGDFDNLGLLGEEVELQLLRAATPGPVTIEALATFGPANDPDYRFGWYRPGASPELNFLFDAETFDPVAGGDAQTVNVTLDPTSGTVFDPGDEAFGLFGEYYPSIGTVNAFTQDEFNTFDNGNRKYRFWPLRAESGDIEPFSYLVGIEEATNDDFNDAVLIIRNVVPSNTLPGDYNNDGTVGAADYTVWRDTLGSSSDLRADGDGNEIVDRNDYLVWRQNFGRQALPTAAASMAASAQVLATEPIDQAFADSGHELGLAWLTDVPLATPAPATVRVEAAFGEAGVVTQASESESTADLLALLLLANEPATSPTTRTPLQVDPEIAVTANREEYTDASLRGESLAGDFDHGKLRLKRS